MEQHRGMPWHPQPGRARCRHHTAAHTRAFSELPLGPSKRELSCSGHASAFIVFVVTSWLLPLHAGAIICHDHASTLLPQLEALALTDFGEAVCADLPEAWSCLTRLTSLELDLQVERIV